MNNKFTNYFRDMLTNISYSARTAVASSLYGVPLATIAFMSIAAGTSLAILVSGPNEVDNRPTANDFSYKNMTGGDILPEEEHAENSDILPEEEHAENSDILPEQHAGNSNKRKIKDTSLSSDENVDGHSFSNVKLAELEMLARNSTPAMRAATRAARRINRLTMKVQSQQ